jgi:hypothetical protein
LALNGVSGLVKIANPNWLLKKKKKKLDNEEDWQQQHQAQQQEVKVNTDLMRAIGTMDVGLAISVFLLQYDVPLPKAVGFGLLPRIGCYLWYLAGYHQQSQFMLINTVMTSWCAISLLTGISSAQKTWKIFSVMSFLKGMWLVVAPKAALSKFLGMAGAAEGRSWTRIQEKLSKELGHTVVMSATFMACLAWGLDPSRAAQNACLALWLLLIADMLLRG